MTLSKEGLHVSFHLGSTRVRRKRKDSFDIHVLPVVHASFSLQKRGTNGDVPVTLQLTLFDGEDASTSVRRGDCTVTSECPIRVDSFHR